MKADSARSANNCAGPVLTLVTSVRYGDSHSPLLQTPVTAKSSYFTVSFAIWIV